MRKMSADPSRMKSAGNRAVVQRRLQMLHIHVFLVAPLSACHVAEPCADQRQGGVTIPPYGSCGGSHCSVIDYFVGIGVCKLCVIISYSLSDRYLFLRLMKSIILHFQRYPKGIMTNYMAISKNRDGLTSISKVRQPFLIKGLTSMAQR